MVLRNALKPLALVATIIASGGAFAAFTATAAPSKGDAAAGKKIYMSKCIACHKPDGSGGIKLTGNPTPNWRDAKRMSDPKFNDEYLRDCITNGKVKSGMVAWGKTKQIKAAEIENLIAHIHTFSKK